MKAVNVVVQTAFIGDLFLAIPFLLRLKKLYPEHETVLVCKKGLKETFLKRNIVEHVIEVEKGQTHSYQQALDKINQMGIDHVFCLHQSFRSAIFSFKIKAQHKVGFASSLWDQFYKKIFFDDVIIYPKSWPDAIRQMAILSTVDSSVTDILKERDWTELNRKNTSGGFEPIPDLFKFPVVKDFSSQKKVALFPGSVWATKKWTVDGFAFVANKLIEEGYQVSIMGGPDDMVDSQSIHSLAPQALLLTGKTSLFDSTMSLLDYDLIICNDSAPAHMAASIQRPVLAVFGPTVLDFGFRPWNDLSQVVELENLSCRPCGPHGHKQCPLGHHDCMKKINPTIVYEKARTMLKKYSESADEKTHPY